MKIMTCRTLGGPCDLEHRGESADDIIKAQDRHLKEAEKAGDDRKIKAAKEALEAREAWLEQLEKSASELS